MRVFHPCFELVKRVAPESREGGEHEKGGESRERSELRHK